MGINVIHKEFTDEEQYRSLKDNNLLTVMDAEKWKKLRLKELKILGLSWSK